MTGPGSGSFLSDVVLRPFELPDGAGLRPVGLALGEGSPGIEVAVAEADSRPTATELRRVWTKRHGGRAAPLLLVVLHNGEVSVCGPLGEAPPVYRDLEPDQAERICRSALEAPDRHAALRLVRDVLPEADSPVPGLKNAGLLSTHELEVGVPRRGDWSRATERGRALLSEGGRDVLRGLGYELESLPGPASILTAGGSHQAVAVFLEQDEAVELASRRFTGSSPVQYAVNKATERRIPWVVVTKGRMLRLYSSEAGTGVASRGRTETYVQVRTDLLRDDQAGYLWLLFSPEALSDKGTLEEILRSSRDYAAELRGRLRERIYDDVVPAFAEAIGRERGVHNLTRKQLSQTYEATLLLLYRLLFVAYAEDRRLLPYETNERYRDRSLKQKARELVRIVREGAEFDATATHWREVSALFEAVREGSTEWSVPQYDGTLFTVDPELSPEGSLLNDIELSNKQFGPPLAKLLVDKGPEGLGPIDFRDLGVREFGTIYEGLLESELSVADRPLVLDEDGEYVPAEEDQDPRVEAGEVYLHDTSGKRKSTGTYYTKTFAVEYLLEHSLDPALDAHLTRLDELDDADASETFFDFRVADIAMGSGHFLLAAVDHMEQRFSGYLANRPLPGVRAELERLRKRAGEALGDPDIAAAIEDGQLLRRQIARRCIYGVDLNATAVRLAQLSLWIHTFVPGLPLSFLDHGLVEGNSVLGIATLDEAREAANMVEEGQGSLFDEPMRDLLERGQEAVDRLGRLSDLDASEISEARRVQREAEEREAPLEALFDVLTAARLDNELREGLEEGSLLDWGDLRSLAGSRHQKRAREVLDPLKPFHFPVRFPEVFARNRSGFDVIVGNPPWQEATVEEDQFWMRYRPGFKGLSRDEQREVKENLRQQRPDLVEQYNEELERADRIRETLKSGAFPGMGTGDPDLYKAFAWRFWQVASEKAYIGVVLPRSILATKGSASWREEVLLHTKSQIILCKNRDEWLFTDVNPGYSIALVGMERLHVREPSLEVYGTFTSQAEMEERSEGAKLSTTRLRDVDPLICVPALQSASEFDLFDRLIRHPGFGDEERPDWRARPNRELDVTNDSNFFRSHGEPVFNHLNIGHFAFDKSEGPYAYADFGEVADHLQEKRLRSARYSRSAFSEMPHEWLEDPQTLPCRNPRVAFRDVVHASNPRKVWAAVVPARSLLTNPAPYLIFPRGNLRAQAYVLGMLNSSVVDWLGHLRVVLHLNYFILNSFPVPLLQTGPVYDRFVELAAFLALQGDGDFGEWRDLADSASTIGEDSAEAELDALASLMYGLEDEHLPLIWSQDAASIRPDINDVRSFRSEWEEFA